MANGKTPTQKPQDPQPPAVADEQKPDAPKVDASKGTAKPQPRFSRARLLGPDGPQIVGHPGYVIAGALATEAGDEFTREQVTALVERFLTRPIKQEN